MRWIAEENPLYHYVGAFREVLYYGRVPTAESWFIIAGLACLTGILGWALYRSLRPGFIANY